MHHCGVSEVPKEYHLWAAISLIAACTDDRVWYEKFHDKKLKMNQYVILIGPSGVGKGEAIDTAMKFIPSAPSIRPYRGKATGAHLADAFGKPVRLGKKLILPKPTIFLITPELSMSVGEGPIAMDFVKRMTELYTGGDYTWREGTRTHGAIEFKAPCVNWLAGTTVQWLVESVPRSAIESGFFARVIPIEVSYDLNRRFAKPLVPDDYDRVTEWLHRHIEWMNGVHGEFRMTRKALAVKDHWYMNRPSPSDEALIPSWKRQDDLVIKLSMALALCEKTDRLIVTSKHVVQAQYLVNEAHKSLPGLIAFASMSPETQGLQAVSDIIRIAKRMPHTALLRRVSHRGITSKQLMEHLDTLKARQDIQVIQLERGRSYQWIHGRAKVFKDESEGKEDSE